MCGGSGRPIVFTLQRKQRQARQLDCIRRHRHGLLCSLGDCSLDSCADQATDGVNDGVFGFEGVTVCDDFGGFMDRTDDRHKSYSLHCRSLLPAKAEGKGNQSVGGEMGHIVHGSGKGMADSGQAADGEQTEREQHGCGAGE